MEDKWGRDELMVMAAFRYCLGRTTYIVQDCTNWLIKYWPEFSERTKALIKRELEEEFARDDAARTIKLSFDISAVCTLPLGHDCDRACWEQVRKLWSVDKSF